MCVPVAAAVTAWAGAGPAAAAAVPASWRAPPEVAGDDPLASHACVMRPGGGATVTAWRRCALAALPPRWAHLRMCRLVGIKGMLVGLQPRATHSVTASRTRRSSAAPRFLPPPHRTRRTYENSGSANGACRPNSRSAPSISRKKTAQTHRLGGATQYPVCSARVMSWLSRPTSMSTMSSMVVESANNESTTGPTAAHIRHSSPGSRDAAKRPPPHILKVEVVAAMRKAPPPRTLGTRRQSAA